jgi:large subunit ribosomal protein L33
MAKKGKRIQILLECTECGLRPYSTYKNKANTQDKLNLKKYCPKDRKHTMFKEVK